jgi:hypothetical protein
LAAANTFLNPLAMAAGDAGGVLGRIMEQRNRVGAGVGVGAAEKDVAGRNFAV